VICYKASVIRPRRATDKVTWVSRFSPNVRLHLETSTVESARTASASGEPKAGRATATAVGGIAILLWSSLALLTTGTAGLPPFEVLAISFAIASAISLMGLAALGRLTPDIIRFPLAAWAISVGGLFGYHMLYFVALKTAPAAEAGLISYLWPLLIVVLSALLPGQHLRRYQLAAALLGLAGTVLLITSHGSLQIERAHVLGYLAAFGCALTWSGYSVLNRTQQRVSTQALGPVCAVVAALGWIAHALFETWTPPTSWQWLALLALGLGPVGLAFFVWDFGTKHGDLPMLGVLSYGAPVLSTLLLVAFGQAVPTASLAVACALITGGALLASSEALRPLLLRSR
jgi:drug/metabolite transporter (DMT)-like permease